MVTAVLPSSLVARRVSVEDPPPELRNPLPERIRSEVPQRPTEQSKRAYNKPRLLLERPDQIQSCAEMHPDQPVMKANRQQSTQAVKESWPEGRGAEPTETSRTRVAVAREHVSFELKMNRSASQIKNVKIMHFMLLVKYLSPCYISAVRAASQGLNSIPTKVGFLLAEFSESRSYLYL